MADEVNFTPSELEILAMLEKQGIDRAKAETAIATSSRWNGVGSWGEQIRRIKKIVEKMK